MTDSPQQHSAAATPGPVYVSIKELAALTPWSEQAVRAMMKRGVLRVGRHYFQPFGRRSQVIFKWNAVVELIEGTVAEKTVPVVHEKLGSGIIPMPNGKAIDVKKATQAALRLLA